jgi:hypothetical protein
VLLSVGLPPFTSVASLPVPGFGYVSSAFAANGDFASDPERLWSRVSQHVGRLSTQEVYLLGKLALTVEPVDRETLPSLFSCMAILNGTDAANFALDLGTTFRRILEQDEEAVAIFAERAGLSATQLAEMLS